jgi:osomolarity two-component system sensor histidine kinase SLN1
MPNLDGLQSTRLIRGMGYSAPIVALTAFAEESNVKECLDSGMDFFLPKPIRRPALKQVLKRYCATIEEQPEEGESMPTSSTNGSLTPPDSTKANGKKPEFKNSNMKVTEAVKGAATDEAVSPMS